MRFDPCIKYLGSGDYVADMEEAADGGYVIYEHHDAEVSRLKATLASQAEEIARLTAERDTAEADYRSVADAVGYVNYAEGGDCEVAGPGALVRAWREMQERVDSAGDELLRMTDALGVRASERHEEQRTQAEFTKRLRDALNSALANLARMTERHGRLRQGLALIADRASKQWPHDVAAAALAADDGSGGEG